MTLLLNSADIAEIRATMLLIRNNRSHTGPFRRIVAGVPTDLPETTIRIERTTSYDNVDSDGAEERRGDIVGLGAVDLDVQVDDKRIIDGSLYRVRFIHPDRRVHTQLDMELVAAAWPDYIYVVDDAGAFVTDEYGSLVVGV